MLKGYSSLKRGVSLVLKEYSSLNGGMILALQKGSGLIGGTDSAAGETFQPEGKGFVGRDIPA
jgi:hypothetical protein